MNAQESLDEPLPGPGKRQPASPKLVHSSRLRARVSRPHSGTIVLTLDGGVDAATIEGLRKRCGRGWPPRWR